MLRLAIFFSHPTQHHAPWFRAIAATGEVDLHVFYYHPGLTSPSGGFDRGFGISFQWDVPLLEGYPYTILPPLIDRGLSPLTINRGLLSALRSRSWDAVLVAGYAHLNNWLVAASARILKIPLLHFCDGNLLSKINFWKKFFKSPLVKAYFSMFSKCLFIGDHNYDFYRHYGVKPENLDWCPCPIDIRKFMAPQENKLAELRQCYKISSTARVAMFVGKLTPWKRPLDLAQALSLLNSDKSDKEVIGLFVGEGPLRQQIQATGENRVRITGFINQTEIPAYYALGDVLAMTSEHDHHPLVITEAAALGVPAVISDRCGCYGPRDVLRDGENGFVYPCGNIDALAAKLSTLLTDEALRRRMAARARELALTQDVTVAARAVINALTMLKNSRPNAA
jgi:glycosyltransferase involved in cell wall biosynthesis